jgi:DNA-binding NtrC family response regulator
MPGESGLELIARAKGFQPSLAVVLMTAFADLDTAVTALRHGASDYLQKPFSLDDLRLAVSKALLTAPVTEELEIRPLIGESAAMRDVRRKITVIAESDSVVLIRGETGTGKDVVAHAIHAAGPRRGGAFVTIDCAAPDAAQLDADIFGDRGGFAHAAGGTLLLDEVGELDCTLQCKLLGVLERPEVTARVVATSHRPIEEAVAAGTFRQDLFYRLNVLPIDLPPLRDRVGDVADLAAHFLADHARRTSRPMRVVEPAALEMLARHAWPGNVRELQNILERAALLEADPDLIRAATIGPWLAHMPLATPPHTPARLDFADQPLAEIEKQAILAALDRHNGHRARTAAALGIGIRTLGMKLKKWREEGVLSEAA